MGSATSGIAEMSPETRVKSALFTAPTNAGYLELGPLELFMGAEVTFVWFTQQRGLEQNRPSRNTARGVGERTHTQRDWMKEKYALAPC